MPRACLLILGLALRSVPTNGHGEGENECLAGACPNAGSAMLQKKGLYQQEESRSTASEDPITYDLVGTDMRCHPKHRVEKKWGNLNEDGAELSQEQCQAKCSAHAGCKYVTIRRGKCTSFTACDKTQNARQGAKEHMTWKKVLPVAPALPQCVEGFMLYYYAACHEFRWGEWEDWLCQRACEPPSLDACARDHCPQCGACVSDTVDPACWTNTDLVKYQPDQRNVEFVDDRCGTLRFMDGSAVRTGKLCEGAGASRTIFRVEGANDDSDDVFDLNSYEDFLPCSSE